MDKLLNLYLFFWNLKKVAKIEVLEGFIDKTTLKRSILEKLKKIKFSRDFNTHDVLFFCLMSLVTVKVENGYDEVNVQIPAKYKYVFSQQIMLDQENVATYVPEIKLRSNSV